MPIIDLQQLPPISTISTSSTPAIPSSTYQPNVTFPITDTNNIDSTLTI